MIGVPLWCKSNYSFLEGASHPEELVDAAAEAGLPALALTDRCGVYGLVRAHVRAKEKGLRLIAGAQIPLQNSSLVLLARNREGYARLCALLTLGHQDQPKGRFHLTVDQVCAGAGDLAVLWHPKSGEPSDDGLLGSLTDALGDRFSALAARHRGPLDAWKERRILDASRRFGLPVAAATEVLYHDSGRQGLQDVLTALRHRVRLSDAGTRLKPNAEHALLSAAQMARRYADVPTWLQRSAQIADDCRFSLAEIEYRYPEEGIPEGKTTAEWVRLKTYEGARRRYGGSIPDDVLAQVDKELGLIETLRYSGYFLTMWDIVQFCGRNGILCQGRGSAANSAVCYCLGITAVDPVRMGLLFERFLSLERAEPPDIDLDIEHRRREEVIRYMYQTYGRHRAAMVANVVRFRGRSALREVGKALDIPEIDLDRTSKLLSHQDDGIPGALRDSGLDPESPVTRRLVRLAGQLQGFPRHLSIHPGGFLLGSEPLDRIVPVESATMAGRTVIQWDKEDVETMGLFKVDLLGLGALTHLDYGLRLIQEHYGTDLSLADLPADDPAVFDMICRGDTVGVFQIESRAQMAMLPRLKPRSYYDLVIEISLVRPGPITGGMVHPYLRRRAKLDPVDYPHPDLEPVLKKTLGIPLFQEQVMRLAMVAADYTPGEADQLRRDMAAWRQSGRIESHRERLIGRMVAKGITAEFAERVFSQIRGFGEYGFPESHAASFALIAYSTAYLKCHYPDAFACALLNAWPMGFYTPATVIGDAKRHGVPVLAADLRFSGWDCALESVPGGPRPGASRFALRLGLRYIKGLGRDDAERILSARPGDPTPSLAEWKHRARVGTEAWEKLAVAGALEGWGLPRRQGLWQVLDPGAADPLGLDRDSSTIFAPLGPYDAVSWDYESQGLSSQAHLLTRIRPGLRQARFKTAVEVAAAVDGQVLAFAGLVLCRQQPQNAGGVLFLTLEDETGLVNAIVWKTVGERFRQVILTSSFLAVEGPVQAEEGVVHLIARRFWSPEGFLDPAQVPRNSRDFR